jgi:hypothetical protein
MIQYTSNTFGIFQFPTYDPKRQTTTEFTLSSIPLLNRALRITDYGETETLKQLTGEVKQEKARASLEERNIISKNLKSAMNKSDEEALEIAKKTANEVIGKEPSTSEEWTRARRIVKKFMSSIAFGKEDVRVDALIEAASNDEKIVLLRRYRKEMSAEEWLKLKQAVQKYKLVSAEAWNKALED